MAIAVYVKHNWLIVEDQVSKITYVKNVAHETMHLRDALDNFAFFHHTPYQGRNGAVYIQLGAVQNWNILNPIESDTIQLSMTLFAFADIVAENGSAYASADKLDDILNTALGVK
tara:strand:- start:915 stop:1259 length:345 start_codon:yes stop_codon:yes gene_type:complete